jgi:23S rRNA (cytidine1920-2'-O)/16S rRNA (cytidine1409-2'-O)-methyltransferase
VIALVKPQFEAGREAVPRGGVVRDPGVHRDVLLRFERDAQDANLAPAGILPFLVLLGGPPGMGTAAWAQRVDAVTEASA